MKFKVKPSKLLMLLLLCSGITACATYSYHQFNEQFGKPEVKNRVVPSSPLTQHYEQSVRPILNQRCVVCHACYDAPCQLKLSSSAGIDRGMVDSPVYHGDRLVAANPTRLLVDESNTKAWRERGFYPVLNERLNDPSTNLEGSLVAQVLDLKADNPLPNTEVLDSEEFNFALNRKNDCPRIETFAGYAEANPMAGMPYGFPGISEQELHSIKQWLQNGAFMPAVEPLALSLQQEIDQWEALLNGEDNKSRLFARYFYEHLFLANLFFDQVEPNAQQRHYFKVVRSKTPPGRAIDVIATRVPSDDPGTDSFYYRLQYQPVEIVSKTHLPYSLNDDRRDWIDALFFEPDYQVVTLPGYHKENFNPFVTFAQIPAQSRYRFLLEEAHFYIAGFIKGPVCRGQVAVDVINDQFWVFFVDPDAQALPMLDGFLEQQADNLRLPGEQGSNGNIFSYWTTYSELHRKYQLAKSESLAEIFSRKPMDLSLVWDGDGNNSNAALTVFRNFDDAAVRRGLLGDSPKTAWLIDYPLLERIHYLLTVDFDVYGNLAHQLNTRLYMDFLRIEGEQNFLTLLPKQSRIPERDFWYRDAADRVTKQLSSYKISSLPDPDIDYQSNQVKEELFGLIKDRLNDVASKQYQLGHVDLSKPVTRQLKRLQAIVGQPASLLSETSILLLKKPDGSHLLFSLLANRAHLNITSLFNEKSNRIPAEDSITVTKGLVGDYPNVFFYVTSETLSEYVDQVSRLASESDYSELVSRFGVRRTHPNFWHVSDLIHTTYRQQQPEIFGWLDYNRYDNR